MKRGVLTFLTWLVATAILVPVCFFGVILLAGPHSDILPDALGSVVLIVGWLILMVVPVFAARAVWRRVGRQAPVGEEK